MKQSFTSTVLSKYSAVYEVCCACGFLRACEPHWIEESYRSAIAAADTGLVMRNMLLAKKVAGFLYWVMGERGSARYLDAAGGYGMLTRLMRDIGFDFYWQDKYCDNLIVPGFEYRTELGACRAVTAMEVLEHLVDPMAFVEQTMHAAGANTLIFTTELYEGEPPPPAAWWYYQFETGQHIGFFQRRTLETMGKKLKLHFSSANGLHVLSVNRLNARAHAIATGRFSSWVTPIWARRQLGSKVMSDHELMLKSAVNSVKI